MAEVQTSQQSGEMARRFIEFVLMHSQNAAFFLGQIPNPQTEKPEVNLDMARLFIDQLEMVREKTAGNLSKEESEILANTLTNLRLAFVAAKSDSETPQNRQPAADPSSAETQQQTPTESAPADVESPASGPEERPNADESKKRFTKSYGA